MVKKVRFDKQAVGNALISQGVRPENMDKAIKQVQDAHIAQERRDNPPPPRAT